MLLSASSAHSSAGRPPPAGEPANPHLPLDVHQLRSAPRSRACWQKFDCLDLGQVEAQIAALCRERREGEAQRIGANAGMPGETACGWPFRWPGFICGAIKPVVRLASRSSAQCRRRCRADRSHCLRLRHLLTIVIAYQPVHVDFPNGTSPVNFRPNMIMRATQKRK